MLRQKLNDSMIPTYNYTFVMEGLQTIICFFFFVTDNVNIPLKYEKKKEIKMFYKWNIWLTFHTY